MPNYELSHDASTGIVACRLLNKLSEAEAQRLCGEIQHIATVTRRASPTLRLLFYNRHGLVFESPAMEALANVLRSDRRAGDRTAVLAPNSMMKSRARHQMNEGNQVFISESAAITWLNAWEGMGR